MRGKKANSKNGRLKTEEDLLDQLRSEIYSAYGGLSRSKKYPQLKCKEGPPQLNFFSDRARDDEGFDVESLLSDLFHSPSVCRCDYYNLTLCEFGSRVGNEPIFV